MSGILIFGGLMIDRYYIVDRFPQRGQDGMIQDTFDFVGGCAINMAATVKNLGGLPYVISYVGNDEMGRLCIDYLRKKGMPGDCVRRIHAEDKGKKETGIEETGYCLVFVEPDGERTFLTKEGCEGEFDEVLLPEKVIAECNVAAVTGYYLLGEGGRQVALALERLKARGCRILFDPSPMVSYIAPEVLEKVMGLADLMTPNWEEATFLAGRSTNLEEAASMVEQSAEQGMESRKGDTAGDSGESLSPADPEKWAASRSAAGCRIVLTKGDAGGVVFEGNQRIAYESIPAETVDSTGAGDSFSGALAFGMAEGWSLSKAVAVAARCASLTAAIKGPHGEFPTDWVSEL